MKKLFLALALALGMIGCESTEPNAKPQLCPAVSLARIDPEPEKPKRRTTEFKKELEQIIKKHNVEHVEGIYPYSPETKQELFDTMRERYNYDEKIIRFYERQLEMRRKITGLVVMLPRDRIGQGKDSLICVFEGLSNYVHTKADLESEIVDYAGHRARDNANGITLCEKKIGVNEINIITPIVYQDILDLRARTYQICQLVRKKTEISEKFRQALFLKYLKIGLDFAVIITNLNYLKKEAEKKGEVFEQAQAYAFLEDAVKQADAMAQAAETK